MLSTLLYFLLAGTLAFALILLLAPRLRVTEQIGLYVEYALYQLSRLTTASRGGGSTPSLSLSTLADRLSEALRLGGGGGGGEGGPLAQLTQALSGLTGRLGGGEGGGGGLPFQSVAERVRALRHAEGEETLDTAERIKQLVLSEGEEETARDREAQEIEERLRRLQSRRRGALEEIVQTITESDWAATLGSAFRALAPDREQLRKAGLNLTPTAFASIIGLSTTLMLILMSALAAALPIPTALKLPAPLVGALSGAAAPNLFLQVRIKQRQDEIARQLPYAIRQMATEVSAGMSLIESMKSIAESDYGALSEEFERVVAEIHGGAPVEEALRRLADRWDIPGLKSAVRFILQAMESGANIAKTLMVLADEIANEIREKYREYGHRLQSLAFPYIMITIILPTMFLVAMIIAANMSGGLPLPPIQFALMITLMVGMTGGMFLYLFKAMEPKV
ncbi:type II secretion system F family protein [Methanopyrus sp.]